MLQKYMNTFPERVIKDLHHFLMNEWNRREGFDRVRALDPGKSEGQGISLVGKLKSGVDLLVALGRPESHDDIFRMENRFQPGAEEDGKIERGERAFPHDYRMNKFDGDMLGVGCVGTAPERKQATTLEEAFGHGSTGLRQTECFSSKKLLDDPVPHEQALFHLSRQPTNSGHGTTLKLLTNARQGIADQHIHNPAATVTSRDQHRA